MGFNKLMRGYDAFSYVAAFNFDKNGGARGTVGGGFLTIIVQILCIIILYVNFKKLVEYDNDTINRTLDTIDFSTVGDKGEIDFKKAKFMPVIQITDFNANAVSFD